MERILTDTSAPALARAVKANLLAFFERLPQSRVAEFHEGHGLLRWRTPIAHPWFNGVLAQRPGTGADGSLIRETQAYFREHGVAAMTWWLDPDLQPSDWEPQLAAHGFRYDASTPGMAAQLAALNGDLKRPDDFRIVPVEDRAALRVWTDTFMAGYGLPPAFANDFGQMMGDLGFDLPLRSYLGYLDGRPVTASTLHLAAGVAGIYNVATLPEARGRGLGAAITLQPLREAQALGYHVGILQSSEMGFKVYQRLGFRQVCAVDHFYWSSRASAE